MSFNNSFGEDACIHSYFHREEPVNFVFQDACELVAVAFGLKQFQCGWLVNGSPCNAPVRGDDVPTHLKTVHGVNETPKLECLWGSCGDILNKGCLVRHVQEKHLEYRWPCPKCGAIYTRRGVMDSHRATCTA